MGPARTGKQSGAYQFDRVFPGVGRIKQTSGTAKVKEFQRRDALLTKLFEASSLEVLRAFKAKKITIEEIVEADRGNNPAMSLDRIAVVESLWPAVDRALPKMGKSVETRDRYKRALAKLQHTIAWPARARVSDLLSVEWSTLEQQWAGGAADWNHMRRALSRFLTIHLGDKYHPMRRKLMAMVPERREQPRAPDQSAELFLRLVAHMPPPAQPCFMAVALTGLRIGEYLRADETALRPETKSVAISGKSGPGYVYLGAEAYAIVRAAIPCPLGPRPALDRPVGRSLRYVRMRRIWRAAQAAEGISGLTLHDLRHLFGQTAADEGVPTAQTQAQLRHGNPEMTRRYEIAAQARMAAQAVAKRLGLAAKPTKKRSA